MTENIHKLNVWILHCRERVLKKPTVGPKTRLCRVYFWQNCEALANTLALHKILYTLYTLQCFRVPPESPSIMIINEVLRKINENKSSV